jgi:hypothetical protein
LLRKRYDTAVQERNAQVEAFEAFSAEQAERVPVWRAMVEEYEEEAARVKEATQRKKKNPYELVMRGMFQSLSARCRLLRMDATGMTEAQVRLQFSEEEASNAAKGVPSLHDVSPSTFVYVGLELEDEQ